MTHSAGPQSPGALGTARRALLLLAATLIVAIFASGPAGAKSGSPTASASACDRAKPVDPRRSGRTHCAKAPRLRLWKAISLRSHRRHRTPTPDPSPRRTRSSAPVSVTAPAPPADTSPPQTIDHERPERDHHLHRGQLRLRSSESGSSFECKLETARHGRPAASPKAYSGLAVGGHTILGAGDRRGRQRRPDTGDQILDSRADSSPPRRRHETPPQTSISGGPERDHHRHRGQLRASAPASPGSTFECKLDGGGWSGCNSPKAYSGVAVGGHTFSVRAIDAAANVDPTPATEVLDRRGRNATPPATAPGRGLHHDRHQRLRRPVRGFLGLAGAVVCLADGSYGELTAERDQGRARCDRPRARAPGKATSPARR